MGNALCCECFAKHPRRRSTGNFSAHMDPRGPHTTQPYSNRNMIMDATPTGRKTSANRIYSGYGNHGRGPPPVSKRTNPRQTLTGCQNDAMDYQESNNNVNLCYEDITNANLPAVHKMRRKNNNERNSNITKHNEKQKPRVLSNANTTRSSRTVDMGSSGELSTDQRSQQISSRDYNRNVGGYVSTKQDSKYEDTVESPTGNLLSNPVKIEVIGILGVDAKDSGSHPEHRSYSLASTVLATDDDDTAAPKKVLQKVLLKVQYGGRCWLMCCTVAELQRLHKRVCNTGCKGVAGAVLPQQYQLQGLDARILKSLIQQFLIMLTSDSCILNLLFVRQFFELDKNRESSNNTNTTTTCSSGSTSTSSTNASEDSTVSMDINDISNISSESSTDNTLSASVTNSGTNININLCYDDGDAETYALSDPLSDDEPARTRSIITLQDLNLTNEDNSGGINNAIAMTSLIEDGESGSDDTLGTPCISVLSDNGNSVGGSSRMSSQRSSIPIIITVPPTLSSPPLSPRSTPLVSLPCSTPPPEYLRVAPMDSPIMSPVSSPLPRSHSRSILACNSPAHSHISSLNNKTGNNRNTSQLIPALLGHPGLGPHSRRRHSSINLTNLEGPQETMSPADFDFLGVIGKGSFGQVLLARHLRSNKHYAVKMLSKRMILRRKETQHVLSERSVLIKVLNHPYLVQLHYAFTTRHKIFLVLDYVNGGELFFHLQRERVFSEPRAMFYVAEILCAMTYMHTKGIVYRDLKPENLLLDKDGHVVLTDFGLCKEGLKTSSSRTGTFCGTPEYLAPEILLKKPYTRVVDWWTLGAVLYEMLYGLPPFYSKNQLAMYEAIIYKPLKLRNSSSSRARNILNALLKKVPEERLGSGPEDGEVIKRHDFFRSVDWNLVETRKMKPPFVPKVSSEKDTRNIDPSFTKEPVRIGSQSSAATSLVGSSVQDDSIFQGFNYARPNRDDTDDMPDR